MKNIRCDVCSTEFVRWTCNTCKSAYYCNKTCSDIDWTNNYHWFLCHIMAEKKEKKIIKIKMSKLIQKISFFIIQNPLHNNVSKYKKRKVCISLHKVNLFLYQNTINNRKITDTQRNFLNWLLCTQK